MTYVRRCARGSHSSNPGAVHEAWERFVEGEDDVRGVRPEVAISWHRCRDQYRVDPFLSVAPVAVAEVAHPLERDVVFAELGFRAAAIVHEVANCGGIVIVADATGRVLAEWGDPNRPQYTMTRLRRVPSAYPLTIRFSGQAGAARANVTLLASNRSGLMT